MKKSFFTDIDFIGLGVILLIANKGALFPANGGQSTYCEQIVSLHSLLSRAQLQCG